MNQIDDLSYLDKEYYNSLMNLKKFAAEGGDVESLGLTFEVSHALCCSSSANCMQNNESRG